MTEPAITLEDLPRWTERLPPEQLWRTATLGKEDWRKVVPYPVQEEFLRWVSERPSLLRDPEALLTSTLPPTLVAWAAELRTEQLARAGIVLVARPRAGLFRAPHRKLLHAALGLALGEPILRYGLLYEVRDQGGSYTEQAIPVSQTSAATGLHTDSSAWDCVPDFVGLLCERPSPSGGESVVANGVVAHEWLREHRPKSLAMLYQPYLRDLVTPGMDKDPSNRRRNRFPIFSEEAGSRPFLVRYMRYWIEKGHDRMAEPLSPTAVTAFDDLDEALGMQSHRLQFRLEVGDMLWLDNRRMVHGREGYQHQQGDARLLWRTWLSRK